MDNNERIVRSLLPDATCVFCIGPNVYRIWPTGTLGETERIGSGTTRARAWASAARAVRAYIKERDEYLHSIIKEVQ